MTFRQLATGTLLFIAACTRSFSPTEPAAAVEEEQAVYRAILDDMGREGRIVVVIPDSTVNYNLMPSTQLLEKLPGLQVETLANFNLVNRKPVPLQLPTGTAARYYLVPQSEIPPILELRTKFPDASAIVHFSRVGFNREKTQALIYRSTYWGPLAAVGELLLLSKKNEWQVTAAALLWIS